MTWLLPLAVIIFFWFFWRRTSLVLLIAAILSIELAFQELAYVLAARSLEREERQNAR